MAKVVSSHLSARPSCILQRVMGLVSPEDRRGADVRDDTNLAMVLFFFISNQHFQSK